MFVTRFLPTATGKLPLANLFSKLFLVWMLLLLSACNSASSLFQTPSVSLTSLTPKTMHNDQLTFDIGLQVYNPNALPLPINDINSQIALNGLSLLSATGSSSQAIPANGSGKMTLSANMNTEQIRQFFRTLNSSTVSYNMTGDMGLLGNITRLPFQQSGTVNTTNLAQQLIHSQLLR